jgi:hypothetical protein
VTSGLGLAAGANVDAEGEGKPAFDVEGPVSACVCATIATVAGWEALLAAALMTATVATEAAMRTPPPATTVAMMLERSTMLPASVWPCEDDATQEVGRSAPSAG